MDTALAISDFSFACFASFLHKISNLAAIGTNFDLLIVASIGTVFDAVGNGMLIVTKAVMLVITNIRGQPKNIRSCVSQESSLFLVGPDLKFD